MKKEFVKIIFLTSVAFLIAISTNSLANKGHLSPVEFQEEEACKDYWGLEKVLNLTEKYDNESIPIKVRLDCRKNNKTNYVKSEEFRFDRFSNAINRTY